jgi:hypothetical protein
VGVSYSDYRIYVKVRLDMPWVPVPYNTYAVSSIKVLQDGTLLAPGIGSGEMSQLFTRCGRGRAAPVWPATHAGLPQPIA